MATATAAHADSTRSHAHHAKPTPPKPSAHAPSAAPTSSGSSHAGRTDSHLRRSIAGGSTTDDVELGADSPELHALHEAELELFPPALPSAGTPWPTELPSPLSAPDDLPRVHASGLPPAPAPSAPPLTDDGKSLAWLAGLDLPKDLAVRWDPRLIRYLEFFKDDPRGRATFSHFYRRSGRYREMIQRTLRRKALPEDLVWVSMVESGFEPTIRSPAGAVGLWQFMPDAGRAYGLAQDRWVDQRMNPQAATEAAADFLADLQRRFGSWELALASYDMGYGGMSSVVRRYNTNDFWTLSKIEGSMPWETTLYVPKIMAVAIVARNLAAFGFGDLVSDAAIAIDEVRVAPGTALATVAGAAGCTTHDLELLNPELRALRTPLSAGDGDASFYSVKVPAGKGAAATAMLAHARKDQVAIERYVVRFGETLDQIAATRKVAVAKLVELNGITPGEVVRGGTVLLVPKSDPVAASTTTPPSAGAVTGALAPKPTVIVPEAAFAYPDSRRVFYRVLAGDTLKEIASSFHVSVDDLRRWNTFDPTARMVEGMSVQIFVPAAADLSHVVALAESDAHVLAIGSDEFFAYLEQQKGAKRITVQAKAGETIEGIGKRYRVAANSMERTNRRGRAEALKDGEMVVVYVPPQTPTGPNAVSAVHAANEPVPNGPLPTPPVPDLLPLPLPLK